MNAAPADDLGVALAGGLAQDGAASFSTRIRARIHGWRDHASTVAVTLTLAWWATYFLWGTGGREPHVLSVACGLLLVSALFVRPWHRLAAGPLLLGNGVGLAAFVVVLTAPTGLAGADEAASYAYAAQLGLVVLAWATTAPRRLVLLVSVITAAGFQFAKGWLPWWGLQDQTHLFQGTFYWHNQAGIFLTAGALLAFAAVAVAERPVASLAWVVGPLCAAGAVFTTSRGSQLALALGTVLLLVLALAARMLAGALRIVGVAAASWLVAYALSGPPFFAHRLSVVSGTEERAGSFVDNGVQRFEDWRRALAIFEHWPLSGAGFHSFDSATQAVTTRRDGVGTAFAHNGFLQAAADGGLVLALPLFLLIGCVLVVSVRHTPAALGAGDFMRPAALVTFLVLLLHSGMDFDWAYPGLLSLSALVAVLCLPQPVQVRPRSRGQVVALAAVSVLLLVASAAGAWQGGLDLNASVALPALR